MDCHRKADTVTYKVTHEFYQADQKTKAADSKTEEIKAERDVKDRLQHLLMKQKVIN